MKILLTGTTGYIGKRLLPVLLAQGHTVVSLVRDSRRIPLAYRSHPRHVIVEADLLQPATISQLPPDIDAAYFLVHSMSATRTGFQTLEEQVAKNFIKAVENTRAGQIIYLSGISNADKLSKHLSSRKRVEEILSESSIPLTILRAGIIVGAGSASFEIIRDLVEKLPVMVTPRWLNTRCQPIAIRNVIDYLHGVLNHRETFNQTYDIGGPEILTYKEMLLQFASVRNLKRTIVTLPVMTPRLSSYWLYFITSTSYNLAVNLVNSMKVEVVCKENRIRDILPVELLDYRSSIELAFQRMEQNIVASSWKDSMISGNKNVPIPTLIEVPEYGCFRDIQSFPLAISPGKAVDNIWSIGGETGWYYANTLWRIRGFMDKLTGGVGLRRGRTNISSIQAGDALDFWRVLYANRDEGRLVLLAEMKVPGEAWLEFRITRPDNKPYLVQTATFRPKGLWGRVYWFLLFPFHLFIFRGMAKRIASRD